MTREYLGDRSTERRIKLVVTIDTEEDNWGHLRLPRYTCEHITRIPALQALFDEFNVRPTYLVTYPVATDEKAVSILREISDAKRCELGAHCHPWNTPPLKEANTPANSMLCNLPTGLQSAKMKSLHETIRASFGLEALSFRSGRFGYNTSVAQNLHSLGYKIDTSITPYVSWTTDHGPDFTDISPRTFRFSRDDAFRECATGDLIEVPTTIGFFQRDFVRSNSIFKAVTRQGLRNLHLPGILSRLRLLNREWLSPELSNGRTMITLARTMIRNGYTILNLMFHSPSLQAGLTPFTRTQADEQRLFQNLREFLVFARGAGVEPIKLSDVRNLL